MVGEICQRWIKPWWRAVAVCRCLCGTEIHQLNCVIVCSDNFGCVTSWQWCILQHEGDSATKWCGCFDRVMASSWYLCGYQASWSLALNFWKNHFKNWVPKIWKLSHFCAIDNLVLIRGYGGNGAILFKNISAQYTTQGKHGCCT